MSTSLSLTYLSPGREANRCVLDAAGEFRVATAAYRESEIFAAELSNIYHRTWIYLGHESEVPGRGDYKTAWIGLQPVILVRGADDVLRVFFNICPHRGATLCREDRGSAATFLCHYHAWSFKNSGEFAGAPADDRYPAAFASADRNLKSVARVESYGGLVFACLSPEAQPLPAFLGEARRHIDLWLGRCGEGRYRVSFAHKYAYQGNWKFQVENSVDGYHPGVVHQSAFNAFRKLDSAFPNRSFLTAARNAGRTRGFPGGHATLEGGSHLESGHITPQDWQAYFSTLVRLNGEERAREIISGRHILVFPNLILMDYSIRVIQPVRRDYTEVYSYPILIDGVPGSVSSGQLRDTQVRLGTSGMIILDDLEVFNGVQNGLNAIGADSVILSRGLGMEELLSSGERIGAYSDETPQRSFWRQWSVMMGDSGRVTGWPH